MSTPEQDGYVDGKGNPMGRATPPAVPSQPSGAREAYVKLTNSAQPTDSGGAIYIATQEMMKAFDAHFSATAPALAQPVQDIKTWQERREKFSRENSSGWPDNEDFKDEEIADLRAALATKTASPAEQGDALDAGSGRDVGYTTSLMIELRNYAAGRTHYDYASKMVDSAANEIERLMSAATGAQQAVELTDANGRICRRESIAANPDAMIILTQGYPAKAVIQVVDAHTDRNVVAALAATPAAPTVPGATAAGRVNGKSVGLLCWSCKKPYTLDQRSYADGNCPHCGVEIELDEDDEPASGQEGATADASDARDAVLEEAALIAETTGVAVITTLQQVSLARTEIAAAIRSLKAMAGAAS